VSDYVFHVKEVTHAGVIFYVAYEEGSNTEIKLSKPTISSNFPDIDDYMNKNNYSISRELLYNEELDSFSQRENKWIFQHSSGTITVYDVDRVEKRAIISGEYISGANVVPDP